MSEKIEQNPSRWKVGREIGERYLIIRPLQKQGAWQTWWCEDCRDGGRVAVRILSKDLSSSRLERNWVRSALERLGKRDFPESLLIPRMEEIPGGNWIFVEPGVRGESLAQRLATGGDAVPDGEEASEILRRISRNIYRLHNAGLTHGNLHAGQVILGDEGHDAACWLSDSLISRYCWTRALRQWNEDGDLRPAGYLSASQLSRKPVPSDDLLALAHLIYRWLTSTAPGEGQDYEPLMVRRASLQSGRVPLTEEWSAVIDGVLTCEHARQLPSSTEFFSALNKVSGWGDDAFFRGEMSDPPEFVDEPDNLNLITEEEEGGPLETIHASMKHEPAPAKRPENPDDETDKLPQIILDLLREHWPIVAVLVVILLLVLLLG